MATFREQPYPGFCFTVAMGGGDPGAVAAGFSEVSGLDRRLSVLRYRAGNSRTLATQLVPGLPEPVSVVFTRGLIGDLSLHEWISTALAGTVERRDVLVSLLAEDRDTVAQTWRLRNAWPTALIGPRLDAMANAVAVETLVLAAEDITAG